MKLFVSCMKNVQNSQGTAIYHFLQGYDWAGSDKVTVLDVNTSISVRGSTCTASIALAHAFPGLNFIVQDLPDNVTNGKRHFLSSDRASYPGSFFQAHNFFEEQLFQDADVSAQRRPFSRTSSQR
ncbi:uncharacterized protein ATNIH1004_008830 [Aspergillus tanneri]|uniref:O-methyltransferase domain-containing protein n=1 Tax=Aspergillus tanneri TaxID=1220188 RepID=A0A5M9MH35_9EURO|nr:uncharacterized protein ATNIH1004_008830 [Aspergillus tanneri]KAA8644624.1 hypothetical protein ATNIH1004_008830 [Aspergillus tanneri]